MCALIPAHHFHFQGMVCSKPFDTNEQRRHPWKNIGGLLSRSPSCHSVLMKLAIPRLSFGLGVLTLVKVAVIRSCLWPFPLRHDDIWACVSMHVCSHTPPDTSKCPHRIGHSRPAGLTEKSPELNSHTAGKTNNLFWTGSGSGRSVWWLSSQENALVAG